MKNQILETLRRASWDTPAVPFRHLLAELRATGTAVTERSLREALQGASPAGRVLGPLDGSRREEAGSSRSRPGRPGQPSAAGSPPSTSAALAGLGRRWVVLHEDPDDDPDPGAPPSSRLRRTLLFLGRTLDDRSPRDVARWLALVEEGNRYREAA